MTKTTTQTYCIISDVEIESHDTGVRLYWDGGCWNDGPDSSIDYPILDTAKGVALAVKDLYPMASIQVLSIKSESESELIDIS